MLFQITRMYFDIRRYFHYSIWQEMETKILKILLEYFKFF